MIIISYANVQIFIELEIVVRCVKNKERLLKYEILSELVIEEKKNERKRKVITINGKVE